MVNKIDYINPITKSTDLSIGTTSQYGQRIYNGRPEFHAGLDYKTKSPFNANGEVPAYAMASGKVVRSEYCPNGVGNLVSIQHENGQVSNYFHLSKLTVKVGDIVLQGDKIAITGNTGRGDGPHLHVAIAEGNAAQNIIKAQGTGRFGVNAKDETKFISPLKADSSNENTIQPKINSDKNENYINSELGDLLSQSSADQDNPNPSPSENPITQSENIPQEEVSVDAVKDMLATEDMKQTADFMSEVKLQLPSMMGVMVARLALGEDIELVSADMASRLIATSAINAYAENNWSSSFAS